MVFVKRKTRSKSLSALEASRIVVSNQSGAGRPIGSKKVEKRGRRPKPPDPEGESSENEITESEKFRTLGKRAKLRATSDLKKKLENFDFWKILTGLELKKHNFLDFFLPFFTSKPILLFVLRGRAFEMGKPKLGHILKELLEFGGASDIKSRLDQYANMPDIKERLSGIETASYMTQLRSSDLSFRVSKKWSKGWGFLATYKQRPKSIPP